MDEAGQVGAMGEVSPQFTDGDLAVVVPQRAEFVVQCGAKDCCAEVGDELVFPPELGADALGQGPSPGVGHLIGDELERLGRIELFRVDRPHEGVADAVGDGLIEPGYPAVGLFALLY